MSSAPNRGPLSFLLKENIVAGPGFNRWLVPPASIAIHLCIGSVYAWSVFNPALTRQLGVVSPAADDWSLTSVVWISTPGRLQPQPRPQSRPPRTPGETSPRLRQTPSPEVLYSWHC